MNLELLYTFVIATSGLAISPGPDNMYVLMQSIVHGKKYGIATIVGLMTGCLVHTSLVAFGISTIIDKNENLFLMIKYLGALYLFYLAYQVFKNRKVLVLASGELPKKSIGQLFKQGLMMNILNPKVTIFFLAFFPGFLFSQTLSHTVQFYVLGLLFILVSFVIFTAIAVLADKISLYIKQYPKIGFLLTYLQIIVFMGIGFFILISEK